jgi:hypothetical protein
LGLLLGLLGELSLKGAAALSGNLFSKGFASAARKASATASAMTSRFSGHLYIYYLNKKNNFFIKMTK